MATWGDLQSVIQLSAALNVVVFTLSQVIGREIDSEGSLIDELKLDYSDINNQNKRDAIEERINKLQTEYDTWVRCHDRFFYYLTYISLLAFIVGIIFLYVSSFNYKDDVNNCIIGITMVLNAPPIFSSIYALMNFHKFSGFTK